MILKVIPTLHPQESFGNAYAGSLPTSRDLSIARIKKYLRLGTPRKSHDKVVVNQLNYLKISKITKIQWKSMNFNENQWFSLDFKDFQWLCWLPRTTSWIVQVFTNHAIRLLMCAIRSQRSRIRSLVTNKQPTEMESLLGQIKHKFSKI